MKSESDLLLALRNGGIDGAVEALKRVHDAKQLDAQLRARGGAIPALAGLPGLPASPALGNVLFTLASAQAQLLSTLMTQQSDVSRSVHGAVADALGVARPGALNATQVVTWRARLEDTAPARRRVVVRNKKTPAALDIVVGCFTRADAPDVPLDPPPSVRVDGAAPFALPTPAGAAAAWTTVAPGAPVTPGSPGVVPADGAAMIEVELALRELLAACRPGRYTAPLRVSLRRGAAAEETQAMTLELVVHG